MERLQAATFNKQRALEARERRQTMGLLASVFAGALILVGLAVPVVGLIALVKYYKEPEATFEVPPKEVRIPPKTPEHKMNVAKHEASRPKPTFTQKLISTRPTEFALPDLPQVDLDQMLPLDPSELISDQVTSLMGSSGIGNGLGNGLLGGGGTGGGMGFLGIQTEGQRILLLFDVSTSVVNEAERSGIAFDKIREETIRLIQTLPINTRFGLIQFTRNFKPFRDELTVATSANKEAAIQWVRDEWNNSGGIMASEKNARSPSPNGIEAVLEFGFEMGPDVVFLISDASFQRSPDNATVPIEDIGKLIEKLQEKSPATGGAAVHFIGFGVDPRDEPAMKRIIRRNRGEYKEIKAGN